MIRQYLNASLWPHRAQTRDSNLRHGTVSRIQKAVFAGLKDFHGLMCNVPGPDARSQSCSGEGGFRLGSQALTTAYSTLQAKTRGLLSTLVPKRNLLGYIAPGRILNLTG
jgi:hypothetical protein